MPARALLAFLLAPPTTALLYCVVNLASGGFSGGIGEFLITGVVAYFFALSGVIILALPTFLLLKRINMVRWWSAAGAGAFLGVLYTALIGPGSFSSPLLRGRLPLALMGAISGLIFWLVLSRRSSKGWSKSGV